VIRTPETRYAKSGDVYVAYQIMGEGLVDLVFVPSFMTYLEVQLEQAHYANFMARLSFFVD
jgi:hypothetical protein